MRGRDVLPGRLERCVPIATTWPADKDWIQAVGLASTGVQFADEIRRRWFGEEPGFEEDPGAVFAQQEEVLYARLAESFDGLKRYPPPKRHQEGVHAHVYEMSTTELPELAESGSRLRLALAEAQARPSGMLTVVLMGRTTAGKSTLFEALSHGDGTRRGRGDQRTTRDVCEREIAELPGVVIVDVPGVGAADGQEDFAKAFSQIPHADVVLWTATNEGPKEDTAKALRLLGALGKPVVVAVNCRVDLDLDLHYEDFLAAPEELFRDVTAHLRMVERHLAQGGSESVAAVAIHAEAAFRSNAGASQDSARLRSASRIDDLLERLRTELSRAPQRRLLRRVDATRTVAVGEVAGLAAAARRLEAAISREREVAADIRARMGRSLDADREQLLASAHAIVAKRRTWHLHADPSGGVEDRWAREVAQMRKELEGLFKVSAQSIEENLRATIEQVVADWDSVRFERTDLQDLEGLGGVWVNRLGRAGIGLGEAFAGGVVFTSAVSAGIKGGLMGAPAGPAGAAVGALVGAVAGVLLAFGLQPLKDWWEQTFRGVDYVLNKRREQVQRKLRPVLDDMERQVTRGCERLIRSYRVQLRAHFREHARALETQQLELQRWRGVKASAELIVAELDAATMRGLLRSVGRNRAAEGVHSAVRTPGVATFVEMEERAFTELALFPAEDAVELVVPAPPRNDSAPVGQAFHGVAGLPDTLALMNAGPRFARFRSFSEREAGRLAALSATLSVFSQSDVRIEQEGSGEHPQEKF